MLLKARLSMVLVSLILVGCASQAPQIDLPPSDEYTIYARGLSTDQRMEEEADNVAALNARNKLALSVESHIKSLTKRAREQVGIGEDSELNSLYSTAIKQTVDQTLNFSVRHSAVPTKWDKKKDAYRAEVVYKINIGPINKKMMKNIKERQKLYERFRSSNLFKELEEDIENAKTQ